MQGFGAGMGGTPGSGDFTEAATQYWNAWGEMMRRAGGATAQPPPAPAQPNWNDVAGWWSSVTGNPAPAAAGGMPTDGIDELMRRFNSHAGGWFAQMQQLATQFAGQNASPADIAGAWRQALGGQAANPFADVFAGMGQQPGQLGFDAWFKQIAPLLQGMQAMRMPSADATAWLGLPTFGFTREHQERLQRLVQAQLDYQQKNNDYTALMSDAAQQAFVRFEQKLRDRTEPGKQIASARALFDLWIDAAEEAYAEIALSAKFREVYGELVNSQMRLRGAVQREVELLGQLVGMPTRTEMDSAHRKIVQIERELRRMRDAMTAQASQRPAEPPASVHAEAPPVATKSHNASAAVTAKKKTVKGTASSAPAASHERTGKAKGNRR